MELATLATWSAPKEVQTKFGPRILRTAEPSGEFWNLWRSKKSELKDAGISCGKSQRTGDWELTWWQKLDEQVIKERKESVIASMQSDSDFDPPCPPLLKYLPFQKAGIFFGSTKPATLIADEMGLGKTIQAIGIANCQRPENILIICPASLRLNWQNEWKRWSVLDHKIAVINGGKAENWYDAPVTIINFDIVEKHIEKIQARKWNLLIIDEAHYCKNPKAKRTITVQSIKADRILALTGTPILNRPIELFPILQMLDSQRLGSSFWAFARRYANATQNRYGWDLTGASNLEELQRRLRETIMVRRTKDQVLKELPAKRRQVVEIAANGCAKILVDETEAAHKSETQLEALRAKVELAKAENEAAYKKAVADLQEGIGVCFAEMSEIRKQTALAKLPYCFEHIDLALEQGPVIVFAHHVDVIDQLKNQYPQAAVITGSVSMENRQKAVEDFQAGNTNIFIGNIKAAGVGITLTKSSHVIFVELDWTPANISQAEDRCHRIGQENSVLVQHLVFEGSLDATMAQMLVQKQNVIDKAMNTDSPESLNPVPFVKKVWATHAITPEQIEKEGMNLTKAEIEIAHEQLKALAIKCDGAIAQDGIGFNGCDSRIGKQLAFQDFLTPKQAVLARKILVKYQSTQLNEFSSQSSLSS